MRVCGALNRWACVNHGRCGSTASNMLSAVLAPEGSACCTQLLADETLTLTTG
jgi:hypothetical protein